MHCAWLYGALETSKVLMDAGADPTISTNTFRPVSQLWDMTNERRMVRTVPVSPQVPSGQPTEFLSGILTGIQSISHQIFTKGQHFGVSELRDSYGRSSFLRAFRSGFVGTQELWQVATLLLNTGCNILDVDNQGATCLHFFFEVLDYKDPCIQVDFLRLLIRKGADVRARNHYGISVSDVAYGIEWPLGYSTGSQIAAYRGDLWDSVLSFCGYDISEFRAMSPRLARYGSWYSREDFDRLWKDREAQCPYWNDVPWPALSKGFEEMVNVAKRQFMQEWRLRDVDLALSYDEVALHS